MTVILDKPEDWEPWPQLRREKATVDGTWKYCDVSKKRDELPTMVEITKPTPGDVKEGAEKFSQLDAAQIAFYTELLHN